MEVCSLHTVSYMCTTITQITKNCTHAVCISHWPWSRTHTWLYSDIRNWLRMLAYPFDWLSYSLSLVLFFYILYAVTHTWLYQLLMSPLGSVEGFWIWETSDCKYLLGFYILYAVTHTHSPFSQLLLQLLARILHSLCRDTITPCIACIVSPLFDLQPWIIGIVAYRLHTSCTHSSKAVWYKKSNITSAHACTSSHPHPAWLTYPL